MNCPNCKTLLLSGRDGADTFYLCRCCLQVFPHVEIDAQKAVSRVSVAHRSEKVQTEAQEKKREMIYEIELPLPPKGASANRRGHWAKHSGAVANYRYACKCLFRQMLWTYEQQADRMQAHKSFDSHWLFPKGCTVHYDFYMARRRVQGTLIPDDFYRPLDRDNALFSCKAVQDAMMDACLVPVDTARFVSIGEVRLLRTQQEHQGRCCLVLRLEAQK